MDYEDRNPSPPPEVEALKAETSIGDTTFSKHWLFQCLLDVIKHVESEAGQSEDGMTNLNEQIEMKMCTLWDMSANQEVCELMQEFRASEMFVQMMASTKSPRLLEIIVGILGNMCTFDDICLSVSKTDSIIRVSLWLLGSTDAPTLIQLSRLLLTALARPSTRSMWLDELRDNLAPVVDHLQHNLSNSLNGDVVSCTVKLVDKLSDIHPEVSAALANVHFVRALSTSVMQLLSEHSVLTDYWHILYTLECEHQFAFLLEPLVDELATLLKAMLMSLPDDLQDSHSESRYQTLCLPFCFIANLSDKARHQLLDDSAVSDFSFGTLSELDGQSDLSEFGDMLKTALQQLTSGITR